jgi:hypothetical protein
MKRLSVVFVIFLGAIVLWHGAIRLMRRPEQECAAQVRHYLDWSERTLRAEERDLPVAAPQPPKAGGTVELVSQRRHNALIFIRGDQLRIDDEWLGPEEARLALRQRFVSTQSARAGGMDLPQFARVVSDPETTWTETLRGLGIASSVFPKVVFFFVRADPEQKASVLNDTLLGALRAPDDRAFHENWAFRARFELIRLLTPQCTATGSLALWYHVIFNEIDRSPSPDWTAKECGCTQDFSLFRVAAQGPSSPPAHWRQVYVGGMATISDAPNAEKIVFPGGSRWGDVVLPLMKILQSGSGQHVISLAATPP